MTAKRVVMYVLGTRPEFIRSANVFLALRSVPELRLVVVHTGQHFDWTMSQGLIEELRLGAPDVHLNCGGRTRPEQVASMLSAVAGLVDEYHPDAVCVFGDTNSSLAAALGASTTGTRLVHLEAGCRSYDMTMPEEVNRRLIDHASDLLLCVSAQCVANLRHEKVLGTVYNVGDPLYDTFSRLYTQARLDTYPQWSSLVSDRYCLMTLHRQALVDDSDRLLKHLRTVSRFAETHGVRVIFPVHPRTASRLSSVTAAGLGAVEMVPPVLYEELLALLSRASLVVTDSGGLQKEAFWASVPCVTVRTTTEWVETIQLGANCLAMDDALAAALDGMIQVKHEDIARQDNPYWQGDASQRISRQIAEFLA